MFLREQASLLRDVTNGVLLGEVVASQQGQTLSACLDIVAPALDNYRVRVMTVSHHLFFYPVNIIANALRNQTFSCNGERSFVEILKRILSSAETHRIVAALNSQGKAGSWLEGGSATMSRGDSNDEDEPPPTAEDREERQE